MQFPTVGSMLHSVLGFCVLASSICSAQVAYSRIVPYDPRYLMRRIPVRRSAEPEPRIRLPITRYFPQVDTQIASAPYVPQEAVAPAAYRLANGEIYALPSKWAEDVVPLSVVERNEENDYDTYDYDSDFGPVYPRTYPNEFALTQEVEPQEVDGDLYNDLMVNYLLGEMQPSVDESEISEVQRRSGGNPTSPVLATMDKEAPAEKENQNATKTATYPPTTSAPETSSVAHASPSPAAVAQPSIATPVVPKKENFELQKQKTDFLMTHRAQPAQNHLWRDLNYNMKGQKEVPLYRQFPASPMASLESQLSRAKTSGKNKDALPLIEKMMTAVHQPNDPLKEQLDSLKFRNM